MTSADSRPRGAATGALPTVPALVVGTVRHTRRTPLTHRFAYGVYQWLVDVDDLPRLPWWLRPFSTFRSADHVGDPERSLRSNVEHLVHAQTGLDVRGRRILMLANARTLGHVFDPLSVFWVLGEGPDAPVEVIVAEVHNTYGERHAYLVQPDDHGRADVDKQFYVSPFFTVDGKYDLRFHLRPDAVGADIVLRQGGEAVFSATFRGEPRPVTPGRLARLVLARPFMTHRVSLLIRLHGVWLWLRRLPVVPRPQHEPQEGTR